MLCPQCGQPAPHEAEFCPACGSRLDARDEDPPDEIAGPVHAPAGTRGYAGFWRRTVALCIDSIALGIIGLPIGLIPDLAPPVDAGPSAALGRLSASIAARLLLAWIYYASLESSAWQATLGKRAIGIRVTDGSGARIGFGRASGRYVAKLLSCLTIGLGFLIAAFTARRQALHDLLANTLVMR